MQPVNKLAMQEITGAYGGDDVDGEDGSSYLEEEAKINTTDVFDIHPLTGSSYLENK